jgi:polar amino acid transport system substrate-binding protein
LPNSGQNPRVSHPLQRLLSIVFLCLALLGADLRPLMAQSVGVQPLRSLQDLQTAQIGVLTGSAQDEYARREFPRANLLHFNSFPDLLLGVNSGQVDAGLYSYAHLLEALKTAPQLGFLEERAVESEMGIAFHPQNRELLESFNAFLAQLQSSGVQADMNRRWFDERRYEMPEIPNPSPQGELRVGMTSTLGLPFIGLKDRELIGYEVEMAQRFAAHLGRSLRIVDLELGSLIASLVTHKIDLIGNNLVMTEERSKRVAFSDKTLDFYSSAFALKSRLAVAGTDTNQPAPAAADVAPSQGPAPLRSLKDIETARIAVLAGSAYDEHALKNYPRATILQFKTPPDVAMAVAAGKADVALFNHESSLELFKRTPELGFLEEKAFVSDMSLGFSQQDSSLRESFNDFLQAFRASGGYDDMVSRWFIERRYEHPEIPNPGGNGELRVGITVTQGLPYVTLQQRKLIGYEVELAERFAAHLGRTLRVVDLEFSGLIAALAAGKIDLIGTTLVVTNERAKRIAFSDPVLQMQASALALKSRLGSDASPADAALSQGPARLRSLRDIETARIGVLDGSTFDEHVQKNYPRANALQYKSPADLAVAVSSGKVDVAFYDRVSALELFTRAPDLAFLEPRAFSSPLALGFDPRNSELLDAFNAFLRDLQASGMQDSMVAYWFDERRDEPPVVVNPGTGTELRVGITTTRGLPYVTLRERRLVGYEVELAERFAAHLGRPLRWVDLELSGQIASLESGKIDFIGSVLAWTEERAKRVAFSDRVLDLDGSVIALKSRLGESSSPPMALQGAGSGRPETLMERLHANLIEENRFELILSGLGVTAIISVLAAVFGTLLGAVICFLRMSRQRLLSAFAGFYIWLLRGIPVLVLLMIIYYIVFASVDVNAVAVAAVAFGLNMGAYSSEIFRSAIQSIDRGQTEAGIAGGFTRTQTFRLIVLPQAMRQALPVYKGELISLIKMTSVVGYIAVQDLTKASDIIRSRTFDAFVPLILTAIIYLAIAWAITWALDRVEWRLTPRHLRLGARRDA